MKSMCVYCERKPHQPHTNNCPAINGVQSYIRHYYHGAEIYLRRRRVEECYLPRIMYLVETNHLPDSPAAFYNEENKA